MTNEQRIRVGSVGLHSFQYDDAVEYIINASKNPTEPLAIRLTNAWCIVMAEDHPEYANVLNEPGLTLPDGRPVAKRMRQLRPDENPEPIRGPSLFRSVLDRGRPQGLRHFFLGSTEAVLTEMIGNLISTYPGLSVAGKWAPPFGPVTEEFIGESVRRFKDSGADILWVGLGSPKQDFVTNKLTYILRVPCIGVGAAFDFVAGSVREAPPFIQRSGLEWAFRLVTEPRRLWRRYLVGNARFLWIAYRK